jgi:hypothetical protein
LALLPRNFETAKSRDELIHDASGLSLRAAWRSENVAETRLEPDGEIWPAGQHDAAEWIGPIIFVSGSLLSENPNAINVALGVLANYLTDFFRGPPRAQRQAQLSVVVETEAGETRRIDYKGPADGISELPDVVKELRR